MTEHAPAGWYPDGHGNHRFWNGSAWTEQVRTEATPDVPAPAKKEGTFGRLGSSVKKTVAAKKAARDEHLRKQKEDAQAAGTLVTSGVFGTSTIEIYEHGHVRVASWPENATQQRGARSIDKDTPYERLRSIKFTEPDQGRPSGAASALEGAVGPAVASLMKGGKAIMKTSVPGLTAAGIAHVASNQARKSLLTITTDKQIHLLANQTQGTFMKSSNKAHNEVGRALETAGLSVLGETGTGTQPATQEPVAATPSTPTMVSQTAAAPTLSDRLRELADLHREGILSDEEFAAAKSKLLGGL